MLASLPRGVVLNALLALLEALESAGIGCTVSLDRDGQLERAYANEALATLVGCDLEKILAAPPMAFTSGAERSRLAAMRTAFDKEGKYVQKFESVIARADGDSVPVEIGLAFVPLDGARAVVAFVHDLSERARIERALRESEERFRKVSEASPDSITVVANGRFIYANPVALRQLGMTFEQLEKVDPMSLTPPEQLSSAMDIAAQLARGETPPTIEFRSTGPGGRETVFESSMSLASMNGAPAIISYSRDITERIAMQAELMKQDRLASVGMLAAGVAHELNNPLTSLALQTRKLLDDPERFSISPEARVELEQMDDAAKRMREIIGDLLFMARPVEKPQAHVDLAQILNSTTALLRAGVPHVPITLAVDGLSPVFGFASKLGQVFLNVLRNAAQAVEGRSGGEIQVRARLDESFVEVSVTDNGPGISAANLERVAQPFFTTKASGMGLGLWISKAVMADHGGTLDIKSDEGMGTCVTVRVPLRATVKDRTEDG